MPPSLTCKNLSWTRLQPALRFGATERRTRDPALSKGRGAILGTGTSSQTLEGRGPILKVGRIFDFNRQGLIFQMRKLRQLKEPTKGHGDTAPAAQLQLHL